MTVSPGSFKLHFTEKAKAPLFSHSIDIFQLNLGNRCNLACRHCHVSAGPGGKNIMPPAILNKCLEILKKIKIGTIDITGGSPEMHPQFKGFIQECAPLNRRLIVRSNLAILTEPGFRDFPEFYAKHKVEIVSSLPSFDEQKTDRQRGFGVFQKIIQSMKTLNQIGYGMPNSSLQLHLVHNPTGAYLPASQKSLQNEYAQLLKNKYNILFNNLFCITNMPIGRYLDYLKQSDNYEEYMESLVCAFNPSALDNIMCKNTISIGWDGTLYDCDFNQMLHLPIDHGAPDNIMNFDYEKLKKRQIVVDNHCFGCTAGAGSSCQGEVAG